MSDFFGRIQFAGDDMTWPTVKFDRLAVGDRGDLLLVSVVAPTQIVKGIRGYLNTAKKGTITATGIRVRQASEPEGVDSDAGNLWKLPDGYSTETHRLQFGMAHAMFVSRSPGFLKSVSEEALWQELSSARFSTPLLRSWMPWITRELMERQLLVEAHCYRCSCGVLQATSADLDAIVSDGLKQGSLLIRRQLAVA
jgi:hypothetical protein